MDLNFEGMAYLNKGPTPENLARARDFYARALGLDPGNIEALVGTAQVDVSIGASRMRDGRVSYFSNAQRILTEVLLIAARGSPRAPRFGPNCYQPAGARHC